GPDQAADVAGQGRERGVDDRRARKVGLKWRSGRAVRQMREFEAAGPQVERLVLERGVRPEKPGRKYRLSEQDDRQRPRRPQQLIHADQREAGTAARLAARLDQKRDTGVLMHGSADTGCRRIGAARTL